MFGWLDRLWRFIRRDDRLLFRYWDGTKQRAIDPFVAWRAVWQSADCDWMEDVTIRQNQPKEDGTPFYSMQDVYDAEDRLRTMTRAVFGVQEWKENQPGLTLDETDSLLNRFMLFCADLKKKRNLLPTSSARSASMERPASAGTADSPAGPAPASPSSPIESTADAPAGP